VKYDTVTLKPQKCDIKKLLNLDYEELRRRMKAKQDTKHISTGRATSKPLMWEETGLERKEKKHRSCS